MRLRHKRRLRDLYRASRDSTSSLDQRMEALVLYETLWRRHTTRACRARGRLEAQVVRRCRYAYLRWLNTPAGIVAALGGPIELLTARGPRLHQQEVHWRRVYNIWTWRREWENRCP